jgi:glutamine amidotransferase
VNADVTLIDYGAGNLKSVENALRAAGAQSVCVTADPDRVANADRIVLPGVGAFGHCIASLSAIDGMIDALNFATGPAARPFLGVCVGMQLMADFGEEHGQHAGLGWIRGTVRRLEPDDPSTKIPHMGWNDVFPEIDHPLIRKGEAYFLHSFAFEGEEVLATTRHGHEIVAAIGNGNRIGVQFHPEKSQRFGIELLSDFLDWAP